MDKMELIKFLPEYDNPVRRGLDEGNAVPSVIHYRLMNAKKKYFNLLFLIAMK